MHVGLFTPSWPLRASSNGIVTYVHWMREGLLTRGHRVSVFTGTRPEASSDPDLHVVPHAPTPVIRRWLNKGLDAFSSDIGRNLSRHVLAVHRRSPIDVFEMEESFGWFLPLMNSQEFPVVVKLHGPAFLSLIDEERLSRFGQRKVRVEGRALAQANVITSPSYCTLVDTLKEYQLTPRFSAHIVNPLGLAKDVLKWTADGCDRDSILFVGRFDKRKGGDRVLAIFRRMLKQRPRLRLIFVGVDAGIVDANGRLQQFDEYAATVMTPAERAQVTFLGKQAPDAIARLRVSSAAVLVASRWESQGYTALEAMAQACPVICADNSGLREAIEDGRNGLLFVGDDFDGAARQAFRAIDEPGFATKLGQHAREDVLTRHDPQRVVDETLDLYDRIRNGSPAASSAAR